MIQRRRMQVGATLLGFCALLTGTTDARALDAQKAPRIDLPQLVAAQSPLQRALVSLDGSQLFVLQRNGTMSRYSTSDLQLQAQQTWPPRVMAVYPGRSPEALLAIEASDEGVALREHRLLPASATAINLELAGRLSAFSGLTGPIAQVVVTRKDGQRVLQQFAADQTAVSEELPPALDFAYAPGTTPKAQLIDSGGQLVWRALQCPAATCVDLPASDVSEDIIGATSDGTTLNVWVIREGFRVPARWSFIDGKLDVLARPAGADFSHALVSPSDGQLEAASTGRGPLHWIAFNQGTAAALQQVGASVRGFPNILARSSNAEIWLIRYEAATHTPMLWLFDARNGTARPIPGQSVPRPPLPAALFQDIVARDGTLLPSYLHPPAHTTCPASGCPLVVVPHGGPNKRDGDQYQVLVEMLQRRGIWVLRTNFRGSTGFGQSFRAAGDGQWGGKITEDVIDAMQWAQNQPGVDPHRTCIVGESFGGFTAINAASLRPDLVACASSLNGGGDLMAFSEAMEKEQSEVAQGLRIQLADPKSEAGRALIQAQSPMSRLASLQMPLLLAYGDADSVSPSVETTNLMAALGGQHAGNALLVRFRGSTHQLDDAMQVRHLDLLDRFISRTLALPAPEETADLEGLELSGNLRLLDPR